MNKLRTAVIGALLLAIVGCFRYPEVSGNAYEMSETLTTVCNMQSAEQLKKYRELLAARVAAGELTQQENDLLTQIADMAESGDWQGAELEARQLMLDQAGR